MGDAKAEQEKAVMNVILTVVAAIVGVPLLAFLLVKLVNGGLSADPSSPGMTANAVAARIQPVGVAKVDENGAPGSRTGKSVAETICLACHATGMAGSPKYGDTAAWAPRIGKGFNTLLDHALHGFNAMPARGGASDLTDDEVARAVAYMANAAGAKFTEPPVKGTDAAATATSAPATIAVADTKVDPAVKGKEIYSSVCIACHGTGVAGAPKFGDKAAWAPRLKGGVEDAIQIGVKGLNAMPPKGGYTGSDAEFHAAAEYMINASK